MAQQAVIKTYFGSQEKAIRQFRTDAVKMAEQGYVPVSESYEPGAYGCGDFLVAALLCFLLIGFVIFFYMLIVKPAGKLTVTYEYDPGRAAGDKTCPRCTEKVKAAAVVCRSVVTSSAGTTPTLRCPEPPTHH